MTTPHTCCARTRMGGMGMGMVMGCEGLNYLNSQHLNRSSIDIDKGHRVWNQFSYIHLQRIHPPMFFHFLLKKKNLKMSIWEVARFPYENFPKRALFFFGWLVCIHFSIKHISRIQFIEQVLHSILFLTIHPTLCSLNSNNKKLAGKFWVVFLKN